MMTPHQCLGILFILYCIWKLVTEYRKNKPAREARKAVTQSHGSPLRYSEFAEILEEFKRAIIIVNAKKTEHGLPASLQQAKLSLEIDAAVASSQTELSNVILAEIARLEKSDEYGALILAGGDIKKKLEFWNEHIPNLKQFIVSACERVVLAQRKG